MIGLMTRLKEKGTSAIL